ncbi:MAG: hypothetical protein GX593_05405 [Actinomycetales bacterium]|nr:hypothetical protein [Actinomycetales bacterium]
MNGQVTTPGHVRLVLPGSWVNVPLVDPDTTKAFAQRVVREQVGRDDRLARVRRDAVQQVCDLAENALSMHAHTLALALEIAPGVPFAASMVGRDVEWPDGDEDDVVPVGAAGPSSDQTARAAGETDETDIEARLAAAYPGAELRALPAGAAARMQESGVLKGKDEQTSSVSVLYRIPRPDSDRVLALRFTAPDIGRPEIIAQLFDAIAGSVEFTRERLFAAAPDA